jgi:hypothetical protein
MSKYFCGTGQNIHASDTIVTLHGVVFDILVGSEQRGSFACAWLRHA